MWQGPAALHPYTQDRVHVTNPEAGEPVGRPTWMRISDYTAGMVCNWSAHLIDVANLCNGTNHTGPISCKGEGEFSEKAPNVLYDTIIDMNLHYKYASGVKLDCKIDNAYLRVEGEEGWIQAHWHSKGGLQAHDRNIFRTQFRKSDELVSTKSDKQDFIDAITTGSPVMIDAEAGHRVHSQCLLGLVTAKLGKRLEWDPKKEQITNNPEAEAMMKHSSYRSPWNLKDFI